MVCKRLRRAVGVALLGMLPCVVGAAPDYFATSPASGKYTRALGLNEAGRYGVNSFGPESPYEAASIDGGGMAESIGSLGGYIARIRSLNNAGEAVGVSTTGFGEYHAFLYSGGRMQDLTARYGILDPRDINDRGEIAAQAPDFRAVVLRNGVVDDFGPPNSVPGDMNNKGETLVEYYPGAGQYRTAIYRGGALVDLPRVDGRQVFGQAINDAGWVTGYFTTAEGKVRAFLFDGVTVTDLTPWATTSFGYDINNAGQVVGVADDRAFLYADGELIDLNTRIDPDADLLLISAYEINDRSQILASSCDRAGVFCYGARLLDPVPPVPEPAAVAMLPVGLALLRLLGVAGRKGNLARTSAVSGLARRLRRHGRHGLPCLLALFGPAAAAMAGAPASEPVPGSYRRQG